MIAWQVAYTRARSLEKRKEWNAAAASYSAILDRGEESNAKILYRLGHCRFQMGLLDGAEECIRKAVEIDPGQAAWHYRLGFIRERSKDLIDARSHYIQALALAPENPSWRHRLEAVETALRTNSVREKIADLSAAKAPTWYIVDVLQGSFERGELDLALTTRLGDGCLALDRYTQAAAVYDAAAALDPTNASRYFTAGRAWSLAGHPEKANSRYQSATELDRKLNAKHLGIGAFFQEKGLWAEAADAFAESVKSSPESAELWFRCGLALQKIYDWQGSLAHFESAVALDPGFAEAYYRLGLSHERSGNLGEASAAYALAVASLDSPSNYWSYRLGWVLEKMGEYESACQAYQCSMVGSNEPESLAFTKPTRYLVDRLEQSVNEALRSQSAEHCFDVGEKAERLGCLQIAAKAYRAGIERSENHTPLRYYRLGRVLLKMGLVQDACIAYRHMRVLGRAFGVDSQQYLKKKHQRLSMLYLEFAETIPLSPSVILYESGHGASASGNPLQIWRTLTADNRFAGFRHVWVMNSRSAVPAELRGREDVVFVARESDLYLRYLATARYLINDNTFPPYFIRREGQQYLNTWHGTPLKTLGRDIKNGRMDHRNAARNFLHATHIIAPNAFTAECLIEKYDVSGLYRGRLAVTGYPRIDASLNTSRKDMIRKRLGIESGKPVVLYAPTWRGSLGDRVIDEDRVLADLSELSRGDWHLLYRGHSMTSVSNGSVLPDELVVPGDIDTNDLLTVVDVLITDYSSIFFDFIATGRPIVYYAYDLEEYTQDRGLYFDMSSLPGPICRNIEDTLASVVEALDAGTPTDISYLSAKEEFCPMEDGNASIRAVDFFFFGDTSYELPNGHDGKPNILFYQGSFLPNGITTSYLNLTSHLDSSAMNLYTVVDPEALASEERRLEKFAERPDHVRVIARVGHHVVTPEERWVIDRFNSRRNLETQEMWDIFDRAFEREFKRMFGGAQFDTLVCFEGYARFWAALFANSTSTGARKLIYLHNDMAREWRSRFGYLEAIFRLYSRFDALVSVTESVNDENRRQLAEPFGLPEENFTYCNNLVDPAETLVKASEPVDEDIAAWLKDSGKVFVTLGRLSPEKGHAKLLDAFARVVISHPDARLVLLGDGPLREDLEQQVRHMGLERNVLLAGLRLNPFAVLKSADCFVFSSDYEGQGLVLLEALILNKPTISTDVVGPRSVLEGGFGLLTPNNAEGLAQGMLDYLEGVLPAFKTFDAESYNDKSLASFLSQIGPGAEL